MHSELALHFANHSRASGEHGVGSIEFDTVLMNWLVSFTLLTSIIVEMPIVGDQSLGRATCPRPMPCCPVRGSEERFILSGDRIPADRSAAG